MLAIFCDGKSKFNREAQITKSEQKDSHQVPVETYTERLYWIRVRYRYASLSPLIVSLYRSLAPNVVEIFYRHYKLVHTRVYHRIFYVILTANKNIFPKMFLATVNKFVRIAIIIRLYRLIGNLINFTEGKETCCETCVL